MVGSTSPARQRSAIHVSIAAKDEPAAFAWRDPARPAAPSLLEHLVVWQRPGACVSRGRARDGGSMALLRRGVDKRPNTAAAGRVRLHVGGGAFYQAGDRAGLVGQRFAQEHIVGLLLDGLVLQGQRGADGGIDAVGHGGGFVGARGQSS